MEFKAVRGAITIVTEPELLGAKLVQAREGSQDDGSKQGASKLTMRQINAEIAAYRKEKRSKAPAKNQRVG